MICHYPSPPFSTASYIRTRLVPLIPVGVLAVSQTDGATGLGVKEDEHVYVYYTCSTYRPNFSCNTYYDGPPNYTAAEGEGGQVSK